MAFVGIAFIIGGLIPLCLCLFNPNWFWEKLIDITTISGYVRIFGRKKARILVGIQGFIPIIGGVLLCIDSLLTK